MYNQRVIDVKQLPISLESRRYTDVICTAFHLLFAATLLALALTAIFRNSTQQQQLTCPQLYYQLWSQSSGQAFICVEVCPSNYHSEDGICYPENELQLTFYLEHSTFKSKWSQSSLKRIVIMVVVFVLSISLALLTLAYFAPRIFQRFILFLVILVLAYLALVLGHILKCPPILDPLLANSTTQAKQISLILICSLGFMLLSWLACFHNELTWNGLLLNLASKILPERMLFILSVLEYYFKVIIILALFLLQHYAFTNSTNILLSWLTQPQLGTLVILNICEYIWNLQYLKDTLYFSLANLMTSYYYSKQANCSSIWTLSCVHGGSISGGSLVNVLFSLPNYILDALCCFPQQKRENCGLCCTSFTGIARTDAYAYLSLTGIPYCNSSRQCRRLCNESNYTSGVNSTLSSYRLFLHVVTNCACLAFAFVLMSKRQVEISIWMLFMFFLLGESLMSGLVDLLINLAESLQTCILVDSAISDRKARIFENSEIFQDQLKEYMSRYRRVNQNFQ